MEKVFLNGGLVDIDKAAISVADSGFLYGAGVFETMRSCNAVIFALEDHLDRLLFSADALSVRVDHDREYITDALYKVLDANKLTDARLRLTLTSGPMSESEQQPEPTMLITATRLHQYPPEYYQKGIMVVLSPYRQNPAEPTCRHKTTSYYGRMLALGQAHRKHAAEALWFTTDNRLAEGCISNVFLVRDSTVYTPPIATPVLAGVARKTVCRIALDNSVKLVEKDLYISDVLEADEIFLTNVIMQVMPVIQVEKHTVGDGNVGPLTRRVHDSFVRFVQQQCRRDK